MVKVGTRIRARALVVLLVAGLAASSGWSSASAEEADDWFASPAGDAYEYPISPTEDPELWDDYGMSELVELLQVPAAELRRMSTPGLLETLLTHPFMQHYAATDSPQQGLEAMREAWDALDAFLRRPDAARTLLEVYSSADPAQLAQAGERGVEQVAFVELLLAQPEILRRLGGNGRGALVAAAVENLTAKVEVLAAHPRHGLVTALAAMRALQVDSPGFSDFAHRSRGVAGFMVQGTPDDMTANEWEQAVETFQVEAAQTYDIDQQTLEVVAPLAVGLLKPWLECVDAGQNSPTTPLGTPVRAWYCNHQYSGTDIASWISQFSGIPAGLLQYPYPNYNCHSYAWHNRSTSNQIWIDYPTEYLQDGSYELAGRVPFYRGNEVLDLPGAIVVYYRVDANPPTLHSAVVSSDGTHLISKWGGGGRYLHRPTDVPMSYYSDYLYYYLPADGVAPPPPPPPVPPSGSGVRGDFNGDGDVDLVGQLNDGTLWLYPGDGSGGFDSPQQVGHGWSSFDLLVSPGDFDGDRRSDLIGRKEDGTLWLYPGTGYGGFGTGEQIGQGWGMFNAVVGPGDFSGDGRADLIGRTTGGHLYLYRGNGSGGFYSGYSDIGRGWSGFTALLAPGDFSGDGRSDLIGRTSAGRLYLYRGNGSGGFYSGYSDIGQGWNIFDLIIAPGDFSGDGRNDLVGRKPDGTLWLYRGNGSSGFISPYPQIGHGWASFVAIV